jgi:hypothetical protein
MCASGIDRHDTVAWLPHGNPLPDGLDDSRELESRNLMRQSRSRIGVAAHALQDVGSVESCCPDANSHFIRPWLWIRNVLESQNLRTSA